MEINVNGNAPVYPQDATVAAAQKKDEENKAAAQAQATETQAAAEKQKPDGFEKRPFQVAAVEDLIGPFQFSVVSNNNGVTDVKTGNLQSLVTGLLGQQTTVSNIADGKMNFLIDQATQAKAKAAIADDGYWGAEQTAGRLLDFAKALGGADANSDKIEELRGAVQKGYEAVANMFGGKLPQVTADTYDRVMAGFDEWAGVGKETSDVTAGEAAGGSEGDIVGATVVE